MMDVVIRLILRGGEEAGAIIELSESSSECSSISDIDRFLRMCATSRADSVKSVVVDTVWVDTIGSVAVSVVFA